MDKSIEERAKKASEGYDNEGYSAGIYVGYKEGATEQEQITRKEIMEKLHRACVKVEAEHYKTLGFLYKWLTEAMAEE